MKQITFNHDVPAVTATAAEIDTAKAPPFSLTRWYFGDGKKPRCFWPGDMN